MILNLQNKRTGQFEAFDFSHILKLLGDSVNDCIRMGNEHYKISNYTDNTSDSKLPTLKMLAYHFCNETIARSCYVKIIDGGSIYINSAVLSRMPQENVITIRTNGQVTITGAIAPESAYPAINGYREISIYKDIDNEVTITVYEKTLTAK